MKLFRKKGVTQPVEKTKSKTPYQEGEAFIRAAKEFEKSESESIKKREKAAWIVAGGAGLTAIAACFAVAAMQPLVRVEPYILLVDTATGKTNVVTTLDHQTLSNDKELNKYWIGRYVINREGYDWYTIQTTYDTVIAMSSQDEQQRFSKPFEDNLGPDKVLADKFRVKVEVESVSFVGETAQVRFTKTKIPVNPSSAEPAVVQHLIATVAFHYGNPPLKENERAYNPVGFLVDSYQVEVENTR
jgi:type IV secretion system protein virB8